MMITKGRFLLLALLVALLAAGVFSPGLGGTFVLDDAHTIVDNPLIQIDSLDRESLLNAAVSFQGNRGARPLAMMSFGFDYWRLGGLDAPGFKLTNLLIHALTAFFLALFLRRLLVMAHWTPQRAAICALVLALLWAVHPLQVSSVLYVVQRMQTLGTLFLVLALWAYLGLRQAQIEGRPGWPLGLLAVGSWVLALLSKEDAVLLPAYMLVLELTVLRFRAALPERARGLRNTYLGLAIAGVALFVLWALPHYWSSEAYSGRDFNSIERLLTQGRVLAMYLGQILLPLPGWMPFHYDDFVVSRGLLEPATTLPALVLVLGLLAWAWMWRKRRPVFACGVLLFFAGHILTSNVIALELAFEHRNHFPLIGMLLALADLIVAAWQRWKLRPAWVGAGVVAILVAVAVAGGMRAYFWGEPVRFAKYTVEIIPDSSRAWLNLGGTYFDLAGRRNGRDSPYLTLAIDAVEQGSMRTGSVSAYSNIVVYKTIQGTVTQADWDRLLQRMEEVPMLPHNKAVLWTAIANVRADIGLDEGQVLRLIEVITRRARFTPAEYLRIGSAIYLKMPQPEAALPYFLRAAENSPAGDRGIQDLRDELVGQGRADWAEVIGQANKSGVSAPDMR